MDVDGIVAEYIKPPLAEIGFGGRRSRFRMTTEGLARHVQVRKSRHNSRNLASFTIDFGYGFDVLDELYWRPLEFDVDPREPSIVFNIQLLLLRPEAISADPRLLSGHYSYLIEDWPGGIRSPTQEDHRPKGVFLDEVYHRAPIMATREELDVVLTHDMTLLTKTLDDTATMRSAVDFIVRFQGHNPALHGMFAVLFLALGDIPRATEFYPSAVAAAPAAEKVHLQELAKKFRFR